jgi:SAM-dependent methyltransferase
LDLGCGYASPIRNLRHAHKTGVDVDKPYLLKAKNSKTHEDFILADVTSLPVRGVFDAVIALSVIEHQAKEQGFSLIKSMSLLARKKIVVSTTNGFVPQDCYDHNPLQMHKSGWGSEDFKGLGFRVNGIYGLKQLRKGRGIARFRPERLCYILSNFSQALTYHVPKMAFELFCVKDTEQHQ